MNITSSGLGSAQRVAGKDPVGKGPKGPTSNDVRADSFPKPSPNPLKRNHPNTRTTVSRPVNSSNPQGVAIQDVTTQRHVADQYPSTIGSSATISDSLMSPSDVSVDAVPDTTDSNAIRNLPNRPLLKPTDPRFSSGPCRKHPGWALEALDTSYLGCSHRSKEPKARLKSAINRSAQLIGLPANWKLGILPGSDTGAFEAAMWSLVGSRPVDVLVWESFSADWANDLSSLGVELTEHRADYGQLPDLEEVNKSNDIVFVYNGTTSGVKVPHLDWIPKNHDGLVLCDATSAAFAMPLDFEHLDVVTWSWQKVLGGEAAHGMLALGPRAIERLESANPLFPLPKIFRLTKNGKLIDGIFSGATINTPSMLAVEDLHSALDWSDSIGGLDGLIQRSRDNFNVMNDWVNSTPWIDWLAVNEESRSETSMCLKIIDPAFTNLDDEEQHTRISTMTDLLREENVAFDIGAYRTAPPGFRLWGGPTIDTSEFTKLIPWLNWAFKYAMAEQN